MPELLQGLENNPVIECFDAFSDNPVPLFYKELDLCYPNSKFILTTRPLEAWLKSCEWMFTHKRKAWGFDTRADVRQIHERWYGSNFFEKSVFTEVYFKHHAEVDAYFEHRKKDILRLDLSQDKDHWEALTHFLEIEAKPTQPFPHHQDTLTWKDKIWSWIYQNNKPSKNTKA